MKRLALNELASLPDHSATTRGLLALQEGWLFHATAIFENLGLWTLIAAIAFLLFIWKRPDAKE